MATSFFQALASCHVTIFFFISLCSFVFSHDSKILTEAFCHVNMSERQANCSDHGRRLTYFPKLPDKVQCVYFDRNYIPFVNSTSFVNISVENIRELSMAFDGIRNIASNSFSSFEHLKNLDISGNNITVDQLKHLLHCLAKMKRLDQLILNSMSLSEMPQHIFSNMNGSRLTRISVMYNGIRTITKYMFQNLKELERIHLKHNRIKHIQVPVLNQLQILDASCNELKDIPSFCVGRNRNISLTPSLTKLNVKGNKLMDVSKNSFKCLNNLVSLDLSSNYIRVFPNDMLSQLNNIVELLSENMNVRITIHPLAFRSMSLGKLYISSVAQVLAKDVFISGNETFAHCPNLKFLHIKYIHFKLETDATMAQMFSNLTNLRKLSLQYCHLRFTPILMLENKPKLKKLNLSHNKITSLRLAHFKNISKLHLNKNLISEQMKPNELQSTNLKVFDMSDNPFVCQCELGWFIEWLRQHKRNIHIKHYPKNYKCNYPSNMKGKLLADVSFAYRECHPWGIDFWVGVIGSLTACVMIIIAAVIYSNRWRLKHYIYLIRKRRRYEQIDGHEFIYDAFVGYNQNDYEWVANQLLPFLETQEEYKLCINDRNFTPGKYIHDNIIKCMEDSRKIILVITNEFAKSGWCKYELKLAHTKHIEDETDLLIIMLQRPAARYMNKSLKVLLETTTFIEWTDNEIGRKLFWDKLKDSMKPQ